MPKRSFFDKSNNIEDTQSILRHLGTCLKPAVNLPTSMLPDWPIPPPPQIPRYVPISNECTLFWPIFFKTYPITTNLPLGNHKVCLKEHLYQGKWSSVYPRMPSFPGYLDSTPPSDRVRCFIFVSFAHLWWVNYCRGHFVSFSGWVLIWGFALLYRPTNVSEYHGQFHVDAHGPHVYFFFEVYFFFLKILNVRIF